MIHNFTTAEWDALTAAVALQEVDWENEGDDNGQRRKALDRAYDKARQLAPERR